MAAEHTIAVFIAQLILLLLVGRTLGEVMSRLGQPAIFGQLLAGVLLGPSIFGALLPQARAVIFPDTPTLKSMIDAISQIGILLLLLLTGMETNLALVNRKRRAVVSTSLSGIAVPFVCGVLLAYALPADLIPSSGVRLVTALFLGTALSISSVKIVAMVLMEVGAIRRDLGQLILATAILDDTIAWVIIAIIAGIAAHGTISVGSLGASLLGIALFLAASLTVGRRLVTRIIRWTNDNLTIEVPVITAILLIMLVMALATELIGVHTALGAFVAGILVGQSPILTEHIEGELRGFIMAFFSPVFFAVAGLGMDLRTLLDPTLVLFTLAIIGIASVGKFFGAVVGGTLGGLSSAESFALATGLNARGSTEVIVASIGLSMGALSGQLYTMIVAMAVVTTMAMPPTLRWMLGRVPLREEELRRLTREEEEARASVPKMERALVMVDDSANARFVAGLAGMFAAQEQVLVTIMQRPSENKDQAETGLQHLSRIAASPCNELPPLDATRKGSCRKSRLQSWCRARRSIGTTPPKPRRRRDTALSLSEFDNRSRPRRATSRNRFSAWSTSLMAHWRSRSTAHARRARMRCLCASLCRPGEPQTRILLWRSAYPWPRPAAERSLRYMCSTRLMTPSCCADGRRVPGCRLLRMRAVAASAQAWLSTR